MDGFSTVSDTSIVLIFYEETIMNPMPSLIIVADRGGLIVYKSVPGSSLKEIESLELTEGRQKLSAQLSDNASQFPNTGGQGHSGGTAERLPLAKELEKRILITIARRITEICERERPESWGFAAPSDINEAILEDVSPTIRARLTANVRSDLTKTPAKNVEEHFSAVETAA